MAILKTILTVVFILICLALTVIILLQEGKSAGLGAIAGAADTYWGRNKGRSMEGRLVTGTKRLPHLRQLFCCGEEGYERRTFTGTKKSNLRTDLR